MAGIYRITHLPTGLHYVGASVTPEQRLQGHRRSFRRALASPAAAKGWPRRLMAYLMEGEVEMTLRWWPAAWKRAVLPVEADLCFEVVQQCPDHIPTLRALEAELQGPLNHPAGRPYGDHARIKSRQWEAA